MKTVGIYKIENKVNGKVYIGSSINCEARKKQHYTELRNNKHINSYLQRAWNKYGESSFVFSVIEVCYKENLKNRESFWIDFFGGIDSDLNYNLMDARRNSPNKQTRQKISQSHKGKYVAQETRDKLSQYVKQHLNYDFIYHIRTEEEKQKISNSLKGHVPWNKGLKYETDERVRKNIDPLKNVPKSDEMKQRISNTVKKLHEEGHYDYKEMTRKRVETMHKNNVVRKDKGIKRGKRDPEIGKRISEAKLAANALKRELGLPLRNNKQKENDK